MTVVGVARPGFNGVQVGQTPDIFIPISMKAQMTPNWAGLNDQKDYWLAIIGRLKPGLSPTQAEQALAPIYRQILEEEAPLLKSSPEMTQRFVERQMLMDPGSRGRPILQRGVKEPLLVLMGMVGLVLLIACANVANLLMARGAARQREIAIRMAVGAGRWRLVRQFLVESLTLSVIGGAVGLLVASWTMGLLVGAIPESIGAVGLSADLDLRLLGFTIGLSVLTGLLFGLLPAIKATRLNLEGTLREQGPAFPAASPGPPSAKGCSFAICVDYGLMVGAGSLQEASTICDSSIGIAPRSSCRLLVAPSTKRVHAQRTVAFLITSSGARLAVGVEQSAICASGVHRHEFQQQHHVEDTRREKRKRWRPARNWIGFGLFFTMGFALLKGGNLGRRIRPEVRRFAIINETMARRFFAERKPKARG